MKKIAILGPKNTYSEVAAKAYLKNQFESYDIIYQKSVVGVFQAIKEGTIGIVPIENTLEGYVQQHLDYILDYPTFSIVAELKLNVSFACISHCKLEAVKKIYVQYATKNQCSKFIALLEDKQIVISDSNTQSYQLYLEDDSSAVIIPKHLYQKGMANIEIEDVTDELHNETRFFVIEHNNNIIKHKQDYKMAIVFTPKMDKPGLLLSIIESFAKASINLISIMSRPTKKAIGTYHFFIELECIETRITEIQNILSGLSSDIQVRLLGVFPDFSVEIDEINFTMI